MGRGALLPLPILYLFLLSLQHLLLLEAQLHSFVYRFDRCLFEGLTAYEALDELLHLFDEGISTRQFYLFLLLVGVKIAFVTYRLDECFL